MSGMSSGWSVAILLCVAAVFGSNHVAARVAFENGASVMTAVVVRSSVTALAVLALMRVQGASLPLAPATAARGLVVGALVAVQSVCLYSAVARIPVALALLVFQTFPVLIALMAWVFGGERPPRRTWMALTVALAGLALVLDVVGGLAHISGRWTEIGTGVGWALGAAVSFALALHLTGRWLKDVDGRLRTVLAMGTTAVIAIAIGAAGGAFALPQAPAGWWGLLLLTLFYGSAITATFVLLPKLGMANNAVVLNFEPIVVLFLGWMILGQTVSGLQIIGAFVVVGALAYMAFRR